MKLDEHWRVSATKGQTMFRQSELVLVPPGLEVADLFDDEPWWALDMPLRDEFGDFSSDFDVQGIVRSIPF